MECFCEKYLLTKIMQITGESKKGPFLGVSGQVFLLLCERAAHVNSWPSEVAQGGGMHTEPGAAVWRDQMLGVTFQ